MTEDSFNTSMASFRERLGNALDALRQCPDELNRPPSHPDPSPVLRDDLEAALNQIALALDNGPDTFRERLAAGIRRAKYLKFDADEHFQTYGRLHAVFDCFVDLDKVAQALGYPGPADLGASLDQAMQPADRIVSQLEALDASLSRYETISEEARQIGEAADAGSLERIITDEFAVQSEERIDAARKHMATPIVDLIAVGDEVSALGRLSRQFTNTIDGMRSGISLRLKALSGRVSSAMSSVALATRSLLSISAPPPKPALPAPDDATRKQWELDAAVAILTGQPIPPERQPHLQRLSLSGFDDELFETLKSMNASLADLYLDQDKSRLWRRLKFADLTPLSALTNLETLICGNTQVKELLPLERLDRLLTLWFDNTQVENLAPLAGLANLQSLYCMNTQVTDWSPVDHIDDVRGRPKDWPRKPRA